MNTTRRALVAAGAAAVVAALLPLSGQSATASPTSTAHVDWGDCPADSFEAMVGLQCGRLDVPLDHDRPSGTQISLALTRRVHTSAESDYQGVMVLDPGGPGGSGTFMPVVSYGFPDEVASTYDWIGFDPRGVGASTPRLSCDPSYGSPTRPPYVPTTKTIEQQWLSLAQGYAASCAANGGPLLRHITSLDSARDLDSIRAALGQQKLNYYGYSWGTYLGQLYATVYPQRVRRMVLDSNIDPRTGWEQANLNQDVGLEKTMRAWFGWIARYDGVYHLGRSAAQVEARVLRAQAGLAQHPLGTVGPAEFNDLFLNSAYSQLGWPFLATALSSYVVGGDGSTIEAITGFPATDDNFYANYLAVQCSDSRWSRDWSQWRSENWSVFPRAPYITWGNAWYNAPCASWPVRGGRQLDVGSDDVPPILLIDQSLDGPTPIAGSYEVRRRFPNSVLVVTEGGTEHGVSPDGNPCVDDQITAYLRDGSLTPRVRGGGADSTCDAKPQPIPFELQPPAGPAAIAPADPAASGSFQRLRSQAITHGAVRLALR